MSGKLYKEYFDIDPRYYAAVTEDLIKSGMVKWTSFYPHDTFVKLLKKTHAMLSGQDHRSLWVEGAYGTGKSHAALTVKSMMEASDGEIREYFRDYGLQDDLCQKLIADKNNGRLLTIHRIGSAAIRSDQDLILAVQDSIMAALADHGMANRGEASLKEAALRWLEKKANRDFFNVLIHEEDYIWEFGGKTADEVIAALESAEDEKMVSAMMGRILKVANNNGIMAVRMDIPALCEWIKSVITMNGLSAILFVWDEFTEYFLNNQNALTGFQTLAELSQSVPFYFLIVTHESTSLIQNRDTRKKILDRFVGSETIRIEIPDNIAFQLMAKAMKVTEEPDLRREWDEYKGDLNDNLADVRRTILTSARKHATMGQKTVISDGDLQAIVPLHPYAALLLKHMSSTFHSNARSMFDFIISNDMTEAKGVKWFINGHGPLDDNNDNLLTVDMLWDFITGKGQSGLSEDVREVLDSFNLLKQGSLTPNEERVFKTELLLEAISLKVSHVELLRPNAQNLDLAFAGTDWPMGRASSIAAGLVEKGLLFERPVGNGQVEYTVANRGGDRGKLNLYKEDVRKETTTKDLIGRAGLLSAVALPPAIQGRFVMEGAARTDIKGVGAKLRGQKKPHRFAAVVTFALNDTEAGAIPGVILEEMNRHNDLLYIECLTPMGEDLLNQYVENLANSRYYSSQDRGLAKSHEEEAGKCFTRWKERISSGPFRLYAPAYKSGLRVANLSALQEKLQELDRQAYPCGLEHYTLTDTMFQKGPLAQGAECGITEELKGQFKSSNRKTSLETALDGVWKVDRYWEEPMKKSLPIVRIKQKVEEVVKAGLAGPSGRVSMLSIYEALEEAPFGFMPTNVTAFVMGFVLRDYASDAYFWSNGTSSVSMTVDKMKQMIANAINQKFAPSAKYKEEYIVAMSENHRYFLRCTAEAFDIPKDQCGSIENAQVQVRLKMKKLPFPLWCLKSILKDVPVTARDQLGEVIDAYCGIANTANSGTREAASEQADRIGALVHGNEAIIRDLKMLLTDDMCSKGMQAYLGTYRDGELLQLAAKIGDSGAYLWQVKKKFSADAANWVWSIDTANEKIDEVILDYRIIEESNKSLKKCTTLQEVEQGWNARTNRIRIPWDVLRKSAGDVQVLLELLCRLKKEGTLKDEDKQAFYNALLTQREAFEDFYRDQLPWFKEAASEFIDEMDEQDVADFYETIPDGQFTKGSTPYFNYLEQAIKKHKAGKLKNQLRALWKEKTGTIGPVEWSLQYQTPILCLFGDNERSQAKEVFEVIRAQAPSDTAIRNAIQYLERAAFYDRMNDPQERDRCFMDRVVGDYAVMLGDADGIRAELKRRGFDKPYDWMDDSMVKNCLKKMAEKQYKLKGSERAQAVIDRMDADQLRHYLRNLIADNLAVGMQILKNDGKDE